MATSSLPVPVPPCPACGTPLVADGDKRLCPGCGRAFSIQATGAAPGAVYRSAPIIDLVAVHDRIPAAGIRVKKEGLALNATIGNSWAINRITNSWPATLGLIAVLVYGFGSSIIPVWVGVLRLAIVSIPKADNWVMRETLTLDTNNNLTWKRFRRRKLMHEKHVELSHVMSVRDAGDHVHIDFDDNTSWEVGKGLKVPRRVHEWVARRLALLSLPFSPPAEGADAAFDTGQLDDARRLCPDEACIGVIGPDGRCKLCGRAS